MTRTQLSVLLLVASLAGLACDGREVTVFELPAKVDSAGSSGAGGAAGAMTTPRSGGSDGGSVAGSAGVGGRGSPDGGPGVGGVAGGIGVGPGGMAATPCTSNADCSPGWACDKRGCDKPTGECAPRPPFCLPNPSPVCGCDGATYWNDCLRFQADATLAGPDQCRSTATTCDVGADCNVPYASCSHLLGPGEMCGRGIGNCWVLPPQCDPNVDMKMWRECKPPDPGTPTNCVSTCEAIASEHTYAELHRGDTCM